MKTQSKKRKSSAKYGSFGAARRFEFKKIHLLIVAVLFAVIGATYIVFSRAASGPYTPLYFIKTKNTPGCHVEVHRAKGDSNYLNPDIHSASWFSCGDADNGIWQMVNGDLYFIKTKNVASGKIEVHSATAVSNYTAGIHAATAIGAADAANGTFRMVGKELYFIKTKNTAGTVEVHALSAASNYQTFTVHSTTAFSPADADNGVWRMYGTDLAFVKAKNVGSGKVELHIVSRASNYQTFTLHTATFFDPADYANGHFWVVDANADGTPDLGFVKKINTGTGKVEIFYAEGDGYKKLNYAVPTWFSPADAPNGTWYIDSEIIKPVPPPAPKPTPAPAPQATPAQTAAQQQYAAAIAQAQQIQQQAAAAPTVVCPKNDGTSFLNGNGQPMNAAECDALRAFLNALGQPAPGPAPGPPPVVFPELTPTQRGDDGVRGQCDMWYRYKYFGQPGYEDVGVAEWHNVPLANATRAECLAAGWNRQGLEYAYITAAYEINHIDWPSNKTQLFPEVKCYNAGCQ